MQTEEKKETFDETKEEYFDFSKDAMHPDYYDTEETNCPYIIYGYK